jgi:hypothetical protein
MHEWNLRGHCHENYNAITGEADDVPVPTSPGSNGSDRFYPWGALLALMGVEELFDVEADEGIRFGCRFLNDESHISNVLYNDSQYAVTTSCKETVALRNGREFFVSAPGTNVRNYAVKADRVEFGVSGNGRTAFRVSEFVPSCEVAILHKGRDAGRARADDRGAVPFELDLGASYTPVVLSGRAKS